MRVLITNASLGVVGGTQTYVRDLACWLLEQGHAPVVYSPRLGETARQLLRHTVSVTDDLDSIGQVPDVIHGNSAAETMIALLHFAHTPAVYVCHGWSGHSATLPHFPRILRYIAVDDTCADRLLMREGIAPERTVTVLNAVDLRRFKQRGALPARPRRALVFSNLAHELTHLRPIRRACAEAGIDLDVIGHNAGTAVQHPEDLLGQYDLVFAKAKCAIEAMAAGAAVILCDASGLGGLVRCAEVPRLRRMNFGIRLLQQPISVSAVQREIAAYDAEDARRVSDLIRSAADTAAAHAQTLSILQSVVAESAQLASSTLAEGRAAAEFLRCVMLEARAQPDASLLLQASQRLMSLPVVGGALLGMARLLAGRR